MQNFLFNLPTRVTFGPGAIDAVGCEARPFGERAFVVTGLTFARRSGLIERLKASLAGAGISATIYDQVEPNASYQVIDEGARAARQAGADFVLGLGGGSALDAAKGIAVGSRSGASIWDYTRYASAPEPPPLQDALPIVQVPIVASTGTETNNATIVFDRDRRLKAQIVSPCLQARAAVIDPTLTFTVPPRFTAIGGMNIINGMIETYLTSDEFAVTDRITEGLVRVVMDSLPRAMRRAEDLDARTNLSWAAAIASTIGMAGRSEARPLTAMAHPLSAHYNIEHGMAVAAPWPSFMRYALGNRSRLPQIGRFKRYALLGRQIFGVHETDDEVAAETTAHRFRNWLRGMDMPDTLRPWNIDPDELPALAEQAVLMSGDGKRLSGGLAAEDVENIYLGALRGM